MKTLKEKLTELSCEFDNRIINGDFKVIGTKESLNPGYLGTITIDIDGEIFELSLSKEGNFFCQHSGSIELTSTYDEEIQLKHLSHHLNAARKKNIELKRKKLEDEIREIQAK